MKFYLKNAWDELIEEEVEIDEHIIMIVYRELSSDDTLEVYYDDCTIDVIDSDRHNRCANYFGDHRVLYIKNLFNDIDSLNDYNINHYGKKDEEE